MPEKIPKIVDLVNRYFIGEEMLINCSHSCCGDMETNESLIFPNKLFLIEQKNPASCSNSLLAFPHPDK